MSRVPFLDIAAQDAALLPGILERLGAICASGRFVLGSEVEEFEQEFAAYCEAAHCVAVNSGTSALHLALQGLGIGPGDEVVTVPMTFVATTWAISYVGATPIFVDIDPLTRTLNVARLEAAITPRTKAILPVHLYGMPFDLEAIRAIAEPRGIAVIEDAAQAHGARYCGRRVGALGTVGCFSFYPGKNLGAYGEGGALVTNDAALAATARMLRDHAQRERYRHEALGYNYRMDTFQGAVLRAKLPHLDEWNRQRRHAAERYRQELGNLSEIGLPNVPADRESVFHLYVIELDERDAAARWLMKSDIQTGLHYPIPVHLQPAYQHLSYHPGSFPIAERLARQCLSLPISPVLADSQVDHVCEHLRSFLQEHRGARVASGTTAK